MVRQLKLLYSLRNWSNILLSITRHSHISYVQVGPDFIHSCELQRAGVQDEFQLFNEHQVLSLAAPRHSAHRQTQTATRDHVPPQHHSLSLSEKREQVAVPECCSAPKLAPCVQCIFSDWMRSYLMLLLVWLVCSLIPAPLSTLRLHQNKTREGVNTLFYTCCKLYTWKYDWWKHYKKLGCLFYSSIRVYLSFLPAVFGPGW